MCGLFGYVANDAQRPDLRALETIARVTETRGGHAFGFAWIDARGRLRMFKSSGTITDHLGLLKMADDARMLVGHCRFATHGSPKNNLNNHPHPVDGGWLVHNGVIGDVSAIVEGYLLQPVTECDSEILGLLIEEFDGSLIERTAQAIEIASADRALAMMALWRCPTRMIVARHGNPLHVGRHATGTYFASLPHGLPGRVGRIRDNTVRSITFRQGEIIETPHDLGEVLAAV